MAFKGGDENINRAGRKPGSKNKVTKEKCLDLSNGTVKHSSNMDSTLS